MIYKKKLNILNNIKDILNNIIIMTDHQEIQYLNLIDTIIQSGSLETGRNGNTISIFGGTMKFSLADGVIPLLTTKKLAWKTCLKELIWFIRGQTDNTILQDRGVHIWDGNASREFLDSRGLSHYENGTLGPVYGYQWRNFNSTYDPVTKQPVSDGVDQLQYIIDQLKNPETRTNRRLIMTAWNPCQNEQMALPPCHVLCQFNVHNGNKLSCALYQRSADVPLGSPFNIASYSFLTHLLAKHCGLESHEFIYFIGNAHIYDEHIEQVKQQLLRDPFPFPTVEIKTIKDNINDYDIDDFSINNYNCHESIKMNMRV
jgi:thymidylate synthase